MVLCRGAALGDDDGRRQPLCRRERRPTSSTRRISGRPIEPEESNKGIGGRLTYPGHVEGQAHLLVGQAAELPGSAHRASSRPAPSRTRPTPGYCQRHEVIQGAWSRPQSNSAPLRRRRDGEQVQLRRLRRGPVPVATTKAAAAASRTTCRSTTPASGFTYNGVGNRHDEPVAPVERALQRVDHQGPAHASRPASSGCTAWAAATAPTRRARPTQVNGLPVSYTLLQRRPAIAHAVRVAQPTRSTSSTPISVSSCRTSGASAASRSARACGSTGCASR